MESLRLKQLGKFFPTSNRLRQVPRQREKPKQFYRLLLLLLFQPQVMERVTVLWVTRIVTMNQTLHLPLNRWKESLGNHDNLVFYALQRL